MLFSVALIANIFTLVSGAPETLATCQDDPADFSDFDILDDVTLLQVEMQRMRPATADAQHLAATDVKSDEREEEARIANVAQLADEAVPKNMKTLANSSVANSSVVAEVAVSAKTVRTAGLNVANRTVTVENVVGHFEEAKVARSHAALNLIVAARDIAKEAVTTVKLDMLGYCFFAFLVSAAAVSSQTRASQVKAWTQRVIRPLLERPGQTPEHELEEPLKVRFEDTASRVVAMGKLDIMSVSCKMALSLYGLYKQAKAGDIKCTQPFFWNVKARSRWNAWAAMKGVDSEEAMRLYILLVTFVCDDRHDKSKYIALVDEMRACNKDITKGLHGYGVGKPSGACPNTENLSAHQELHSSDVIKPYSGRQNTLLD